MQDLPATEEVGALDQERLPSLIADIHGAALDCERWSQTLASIVGAAATIGRALGAPAVDIANFDQHGPAAAPPRPDHPARVPASHLSGHTEPELTPGASASQGVTDLDLERFAARQMTHDIILPIGTQGTLSAGRGGGEEGSS